MKLSVLAIIVIVGAYVVDFSCYRGQFFSGLTTMGRQISLHIR